MVENNNLAAAAIDGPIHGSRGLEMSSHEASDPSARQEAFLDLWKSPGNGIENMVADWQISLTALLTLPELRASLSAILDFPWEQHMACPSPLMLEVVQPF